VRIGELAARTGVSVRALRYYEEQELLVSERTAGGHRVYPHTAIERVAWIQRLYAAGLPSRTVLELLPCVFSPSVATGPDLVTKMLAERNRIDARVTELMTTREKLDGLILAAQQYLGDNARQQPAPASR
jgi:DNA-binding transcriptional MerR regulator